MKSLDFLKEGFVEDASEAHQDHEVQMARQECFNTAENALALHKLLRNISEAQGLEGWVSSKITLANDYLKRVREYLEYEFLTKDINEITPQATIAENAEPKKKLIEYKIVSGQEGKSENYVITGLDTKTLDQLARAYYGAIKLEQDPKNPNVTTIVWDLPTAGPTQYGSYDASSGTATFIKKMTDAGDQLAKSVKKIDQVVEEGSDLDQQAMSVADKLTSGKNLEKLQTMRHDSTVYRALDRYFAKNNIPENIYNRVANIVFKRINTQGVAEGDMYGDEEVSWEKGGRRAPTGAFRNPAANNVVFLGTGDNGSKYEIIQSGDDFMIHANGKHIDSYSSLQRAMSVLKNEVPGLQQGVAEGKLNEFDLFAPRITYIKIHNGQWVKAKYRATQTLGTEGDNPTFVDFSYVSDDAANRMGLNQRLKAGTTGRRPAGQITIANPGPTQQTGPFGPTNIDLIDLSNPYFNADEKLLSQLNQWLEKTPSLNKNKSVAEGKKCNHTMEGTQCPVHGLAECPMQENKKLKETTAGSVAGVNNPPGKNSGKKKSQIGSLFGGTYKQPVHETDFAGEKTTPPQKPGDQVRGTEKAVKKGKQQPFYHRLVGNE